MRKVCNPLRGLFIIAFLLVLYGCSIGPTERNVPHTYFLDAKLSPTTLARNREADASATLLVSVPKPQPGFDTARMAYLLRPHEVSYYAFNQWADTPSRMLVPLLAQAMEATGLWLAVVQAPSTVRADYRLDCENLILEQQFFSLSRVRLALRVQLIDVKRQGVMGGRDFEIFEDAPSDDAYGGVIAANRAVAKFLGELAAWAGTVMESSDTTR